MELKRGTIILAFLAFIMLFPLVQADILSVNSGGTGNIILNPDRYIESFFFGDEEAAAPICGNGVIETGEECDDGNTVSGDGCSSSCQNEAPSGGGGGGGVIVANITVEPTQFNIDLATNTNVERTISVTNFGSTGQTISITQVNLDGRIILENTSLNILPGETKTFDVIFVATNETGVFTGTIYVGGNPVFVSLNIQSELLYFDSNIVVLNRNFEVPQGSDLKTLVTLIPFGDDPRLDVTLDFEIKDYQGNIYLTKSETVLVTEQVDFLKNFDTGRIPLGDYVIALDLIYPNGVAPSSAHFKIVEPEGLSIFAKIVLILIVLILIIMIMILIVLIDRRLKKNNQTGGYF